MKIRRRFSPYGQGLGNVILRLISKNKTTAYGLFLDNHLVSAAYTWIELENIAVIGGTKEEFRNMGLATSVESMLTEDLTKRGKPLCMREKITV
ncbi:hypothetical protein D1867_01605 [Acidianus infernus]|uniref:GCN5-related N-acetyltransferase Rv2170-like domain-containing protein n=1 Tax=Acidianus infernus TaxID=12915 RepID=A0A6A9QJ91_ACIIN|nr:GNAT family N-acetyltransferase [Acidianus infernus]MUM63968.1 hypothetical protein [Acidianus infernus]